MTFTETAASDELALVIHSSFTFFKNSKKKNTKTEDALFFLKLK